MTIKSILSTVLAQAKSNNITSTLSISTLGYPSNLDVRKLAKEKLVHNLLHPSKDNQKGINITEEDDRSGIVNFTASTYMFTMKQLVELIGKTIELSRNSMVECLHDGQDAAGSIPAGTTK